MSSSSILSSPRPSPDSFDDGLRKLFGMIHSLWSWINELQQPKPLMCSMVSAANLGLKIALKLRRSKSLSLCVLLMVSEALAAKKLLTAIGRLFVDELFAVMCYRCLTCFASFFLLFILVSSFLSSCAFSGLRIHGVLMVLEECFEWFIMSHHSFVYYTKGLIYGFNTWDKQRHRHKMRRQ